MRILYKFEWDCGRQGTLEGVFISTSEEINKIIGKEIYFGEVLGKHSEVFGTIEKEEIEELTDDQDFIDKFEILIGSIGYNPLDYYEED